MTQTLDLSESNRQLIELIESPEPFLINRVSDNITKMSIVYDIYKKIHPQFKQFANTHDGIYSKDDKDLVEYSNLYMNTLENMTKFTCFSSLYTETQNYIIQKYKIPPNNILHWRVLEPFYNLYENPTEPVWTHSLKNKKVLIINPFVDSFQAQIKSNFSFFGKDDPRTIWDKEQKFVFYKSFNCLYNNHPHENWIETYNVMCEDIEKLDFDIALLGCGGYGLPLCNFIYKKLGKSAIYIGGGIQLLFGVYGNRWKNHSIIGPLIQKGGWIRPSSDEQPTNYTKIEGGCYW